MITRSRLSWWAALPLAGALLAHRPAQASPWRDAPGPVGIPVAAPGTAGQVIERCILAAALEHRVPPAVLVILLHVEGGQLGRVSGNLNQTVDVGPMQVNEIWLPDLARRWQTSVPQAFQVLRDDFCFNLEAGAWILRRALDEARGDFWTGVGYYHSHHPVHKADYLRKVLAQALRLLATSERGRAAAGREPVPVSAPGSPPPSRPVDPAALAGRGR